MSLISCGGNHNLVLTTSNSLYTWGFGEMLALGHGNENDEKTPRKLVLKEQSNSSGNGGSSLLSGATIVQIAGGGQHSALIARVTATN